MQPPATRNTIPDDVRTERLITSHRRWRIIFVLLALALPAAIYALSERQARRLDALANHGATTSAVVDRLEHQGSEAYVHYKYAVGGSTYTWSVGERDVLHDVGETFIVSYLPEDPSLSRPYADWSLAAKEAASNRSFRNKAIVGAFLFVALNAALSEVKLRRLRRRGPQDTFLLSAKAAGRIVAGLLILVALSTNRYEDVAEVQRKAFGAMPFGLPVTTVVTLVEAVLFLPYFWVFEHLMHIVYQAVRDRASLSKVGLASYILRAHKAHPELRRSRAVALGGFLYFVLLAGSWIAFTEIRGL
jgi:hypothetical protein